MSLGHRLDQEEHRPELRGVETSISACREEVRITRSRSCIHWLGTSFRVRAGCEILGSAAACVTQRVMMDGDPPPLRTHSATGKC